MIPIHSGRNQHLKAAFNSSENKIIHFLLKKIGGGGGGGGVPRLLKDFPIYICIIKANHSLNVYVSWFLSNL